MKRIGYDRYGGPGAMRIQEFEPRTLGARDVLVAVKAAAINPIDWKVRNGEMRFLTGKSFPRGMGAEFAGTVARVGRSVLDFQPGDAVVGATAFRRHGAFAEAVVTSETLVAKKPETLSFVEATAIGVAGVTAWLALVKTARLKADQRLLVNGALGGVGQAAVTLAKSLGAHVTGRIAPQDIAAGAALGLDHVLDYTAPVPTTLEGSFDAVFDVHGGLVPMISRRLVKHGGVVIDINPTPRKMLARLLTRTQKLVFAEGRREYLEPVLELAVRGSLRTAVGQVTAFDDAIAVIAALENGQRVSGRSVIAFD